MGLKAEEVFRPGAFPEYTYISRKSAVSDLPYEFLLMQAIKVPGRPFQNGQNDLV